MTINEITLETIDEYDIFNYNNTHSLKLENKFNYNCMAYAFGAYRWINPFDMDKETPETIMKELNLNTNNFNLYKKVERDLINYNFSNHLFRKIMIQRMLRIFPDLRIISSFKELNNDEYGISFATGFHDYHFIRYENGVFSHKRGELNIEILSDEKEGFKKGYCSKIIRFAMKKGLTKFNDIF